MSPASQASGRTTRATLMGLTSLQAIDRSTLDAGTRAALDSFVNGIRRRWGYIALITVFNFAAVLLNVTPMSGSAVWVTSLVLTAINFSLSTLPRAIGYRSAYVHAAFSIDLLVLAMPLAFIGEIGLGALLILAIVPYASGDTATMRLFHAAGALTAMYGAVAIHASLVGDGVSATISITNLMSAGAVVAGGLVLRWRESARLARITEARSVIERAESGALYNRITSDQDDELSHMTNAVNGMMSRVARTIADVQHEAREVSAFAAMLSESTRGVLASTGSVLSTASSLAQEMDGQRERAEDGHDRTADAAAAAGSLRDRADKMARGVQKLLTDAQTGRERVQRASETLLAIAEDVKTTALTIQTLSNMSNDIGTFVHTTSRIARQTHVLALNAAIEAAHSKSGQEGFSAVAEEVRLLAATSAESARAAAEMIEEVRSHIDAVARSMGAGETQVRDVGIVAGEAKGALDALVRGVSDVSELVRVTADVSRSQAERMTTLAEQMSEIASVNARTVTDAQGAARAMETQQSTMTDLNTIATQLAGLSERLSDSVNRFQVKPQDQDTTEFEAMNPEL